MKATGQRLDVIAPSKMTRVQEHILHRGRQYAEDSNLAGFCMVVFDKTGKTAVAYDVPKPLEFDPCVLPEIFNHAIRRVVFNNNIGDEH